MIDPTLKNSYVLRLSGKAELPEPLEIGNNYHCSLEGSITSKTEADNNDGSHTLYYAFKPVKIDVLTPKGETIKAKDTRGKSQLFRGRIWALWNRKNLNMDAQTYYDKLMDKLIQHAEEVDEMFSPTN